MPENRFLQDNITLSASTILALANRHAKELGVDVEESLKTVSQHLVKDVWLNKTTKEKRSRLIKENRLIQSSRSDFGILTENLPFNSPSGAAEFVGGASLSERALWEVKDLGQTYANWQESQLANIET